MFSGIGGFEIGIGQRGECVGYSEIDKYAIQIYERHYGNQEGRKCISEQSRKEQDIQQSRDNENSTIRNSGILYTRGHKNYGDCTKIDWGTVPDFDLLVGGVPCQAWSIAGKRKGFEDSRGTMWFEYFRALKEKQPSYFIAENVKGILSHNQGKSFEEICRCFCELGYAIDFEVLNSKNFGVPQNRERVFIVGIRIDLLDNRQIF